ncbi:MAG: sigma-70 family RNA polymerase sigma factor [Clostridia bacterium]|nr:sigma-70 family RNA polymerase sigma factor [Clostridia bacterium]
MIDYKSLTEEELVLLAQNKDETAYDLIIDKYKFIVRKIAKPYFIFGCDQDDILQEGTISVFNAIRHYVEGTPFYPYACKCIKNGLISLIKKNSAKNTQKEVLLSEIIDNNPSAVEVAATSVDPETKVINSEEEFELIQSVKNLLTPLEFEVFNLILQDYSYNEIADIISKDKKAVDNAVQRIKHKVKEIYGD